jgi:hypothetical protein
MKSTLFWKCFEGMLVLALMISVGGCSSNRVCPADCLGADENQIKKLQADLKEYLYETEFYRKQNEKYLSIIEPAENQESIKNMAEAKGEAVYSSREYLKALRLFNVAASNRVESVKMQYRFYNSAIHGF